MASKTTPQPPAPASTSISPDLKRLHEMCGFHASASKELTLLHSRLEREYLALIGRHKDEVIQLEQARKSTLAGIEELARQHPEWFGDKRQLKTPVGVIKLTATTRLEIANPEETINRLYARHQRQQDFDALAYLIIDTKLDKQALKKLPEHLLKRLGVVVAVEDSFSFDPVVIALEKLLADSAPSPDQIDGN